MAVKKLKWNSLLRYPELEFEPEAPKVLEVSDELSQSLSWLTAATKQDRRLLRCTEQGALLVADAWCGLSSVETARLYPEQNSPKYDEPAKVHKGVLIATSTVIVKITFMPKGSIIAEDYYVPPKSYYWFPHPVIKVTATLVPADSTTATDVGVTYYD